MSDLPPPPEYRPLGHPETDSSMRNIAIAAVLIAGAVMGGVFMFSGHHHEGVPVIEADTTPLRVKPANPGGMQVAGADDSVLMNKDGTEADHLAPPPEAPAPQEVPRDLPAPPPPALPPPSPPQALAAAPPAAPVEQPLPVPRTESPPPVPAPKPVQPRSEEARPSPPVHGTTQVQLAALDSEAAARAAWTELQRRSPGLLAGHAPLVQRADHAGRSFWRLRTGGFVDIAAATEFCSRVRAEHAACTIASF